MVFLLPTTVFAQTVYTFTNAGATGRTGPTQTQINNTYTSGNNNYNKLNPCYKFIHPFIAEIYEGTNDIQRMIIAKELLGLGL